VASRRLRHIKYRGYFNCKGSDPLLLCIQLSLPLPLTISDKPFGMLFECQLLNKLIKLASSWTIRNNKIQASLNSDLAVRRAIWLLFLEPWPSPRTATHMTR
jgi:hypothetical protein